MVRLSDGCAKSHFATDDASMSVRLLQTLALGAVIDWAPGDAHAGTEDDVSLYDLR